MKVIREYSFHDGLLHCVSTPMMSEDDDLDLEAPYPVYLSALVEPKDPDNLDCMRFRVQSHSSVSPVFILDEISYFCQTLKQMYQL